MTTKRGPYKRKHNLDATERKCNMCEEVKSIDRFPPVRYNAKGYAVIDARCYDCRKPAKRTFDLSSKYNLTDQEFEAIVLAQNNRCLLCDTELTKPHVDHCHSTGRVRGILCYHCNVGLGHFKDNPEVLARAIQYLST